MPQTDQTKTQKPQKSNPVSAGDKCNLDKEIIDLNRLQLGMQRDSALHEGIVNAEKAAKEISVSKFGVLSVQTSINAGNNLEASKVLLSSVAKQGKAQSLQLSEQAELNATNAAREGKCELASLNLDQAFQALGKERPPKTR